MKKSFGITSFFEKRRWRKAVMRMKLFTIFMLVGVFQLTASVKGQNALVNLNMHEASLVEFFSEIAHQTDYEFLYNHDLVSGKETVSLEADQQDLKELLEDVLYERGLDYQLDDNVIIISKREYVAPVSEPAPAVQEKRVTGNVTDDQGVPLPGVSVVIKGTNTGVATDIDGNYVLEIDSDNAVLVFSFVGMLPQEIAYKGQFVQNVSLTADTEQMAEVVVTGYQNLAKEKVTGSISTVSSMKIEERYTPNIMQNLEGRVAGLSTYGGKFTIRGTSSLYAETNPLLVVDGMPIEGKIEDLNTTDIESVNVLKDAASTAIYGARASNGIIVITTKNARKKGKIDIDFSSNFTFYEKKNMNYSDNFYMNAEQQVNLESDYWDYYFFNNDGEISDPIGSTETSIENGTGGISPINYAYYQLAKGEISEDQLNTLLDGLKQNNFAKEYGEAIYKRRVIQQYNLAIRSSSEKSQSNLILNYKTDNSGIINAENNLLNINYKGSYDVAPWLTATFSINGIYGKIKEAGYDYNSNHTNPWAFAAYESFYDDEGNPNLFYSWYNGNQYWSAKGTEGIHDLGINTVDEFYNNVETTDRQHIRYHGNLLFKISKSFTANAQYIYETEHTTTNWHANAESHLARSIRNAYTTLENGKITYLTPRSGGMLRTTNTDGRYWTGRGQVNYVNTFGKHSITALAGLEFRQTKTNGTKALILGYDEQLQSSSTHTINFGDLSLMRNSPYFMGSSGGYPASQFVFDPYLRDGMGIVEEELHRFASGYTNLTYTYDEKYNLFGSFRKDYADVYGLNAKFRGTPLWSVGAGWNIHNEPFMKDFSCVNVLKLRGSYGVTGNIYQGATSYLTATSTGLNTYTNLPYGEVESPANPNLKWEQSRTTNIGIDYSLMDNRLRGSMDFYKKVGKDIFSNQTLDPSTGFTSRFVNMASMVNKGIELAIAYDWFRGYNSNAFTWNTGLTFSYNHNEVTDVENSSTSAYQLIGNPYRVGYPTSGMWSYRFAGISDETGQKGQTLWYIEDGGTAHSASGKSIDILEYSGQTEPKVVAGIDNRFAYKGFSLSILMSYYGGHKIRALTEEETFGVPYSAIPSYFLNTWTPENPTNTPGIGRYGSTSLGSESAYSNISVRDGAFLKIRNIVFGYDLPDSLIKSKLISKISLRFQIDNPKALWVKNDVGVDPETLGIRNPSSYIFGLNINF